MFLNKHGTRRECALRQTGRAAELGTVALAGTIVAHNDIDDAADRIRAIQCRALRPANDLDALDRVRTQLRKQQWIRHLDAIDVDLGVAHLE